MKKVLGYLLIGCSVYAFSGFLFYSLAGSPVWYIWATLANLYVGIFALGMYFLQPK